VIVKATSSTKTPTGSSAYTPVTPAPASVVHDVTNIPLSVYNKIGITSSTESVTPPTVLSGQPPMTLNGKSPAMLYYGAEYCPYCAAERWSMINALSRFGTFTGLTTIHSSSSDAYPNTPTWTFYGSSYTSKYIAFTSVEETRNYREGNSTNTSTPYVTLQTPTSAQALLGQTYDSTGSIPFIDIANKYVEVGNLQPYGPQLLAGKTWAQVAAAMSQPSSTIGAAAIGNANYLTAGICETTGNLPATACTPTLKTLEASLAKA
jgi:hypothetical protein